MLSMAFPHVLLRFSNGIVNNFIVSFPLPLVYAQDVGRKPDRDARKTAESGFGAAPDPSTQFSLFRLYIFEHPTFHSAQDDEMRCGVEIMAMPEGLLSAGCPRIDSLPQWGRLIGGGFAAINEEVAAVLAFVISPTTFLAAQDDETGRCPKIS